MRLGVTREAAPAPALSLSRARRCWMMVMMITRSIETDRWTFVKYSIIVIMSITTTSR